MDEILQIYRTYILADATSVFLIFINVTFFVYGCKDIGSVYL